MRFYVNAYRMPEGILLQSHRFSTFEKARWFFEECNGGPDNPPPGTVSVAVKLLVDQSANEPDDEPPTPMAA